MSNTEMSAEDKEFLAQCEEEFKDRYTEKDEDFMVLYNAEPSKPPIVDSWWVSNNSGRRNDRRFNRRNHPYERHNRDGDRDRRGYNDYQGYDNRGQGYQRNHRPRYY